MKILKGLGIITAVIALFCGLGVVGRIETEDKQYRSGEITREEMTTDEELFKRFAICGGAALGGGLMWAIGAYVEAGQIEKEYKRFCR